MNGTRVGIEKNTLVRQMRVSNLITRKKKIALKKEQVEGGTITLVMIITS